MDHPAALHRIRVGVPATVEHSSETGPEKGKWVAQTTQATTFNGILRFEIILTTSFLENRALSPSWSP